MNRNRNADVQAVVYFKTIPKNKDRITWSSGSACVKYLNCFHTDHTFWLVYLLHLFSPVPGVFNVPEVVEGLVLGVVMPTWADMPRRQEPVCEITVFFLPEVLLSDSSDTSEGFLLHLDPGSIFMPLSDPPSDFLTSSLDHKEFRSTWECFSASV